MGCALAVMPDSALVEPRTDEGGVPAGDFPEFMSLSASERMEISVALDAFAAIDAAPQGQTMRVINVLAKEIAAVHPDLGGFKRGSLYRKYLIWSKGGRKTDAGGHETGIFYAPHDWHFLVKDYNNGGAELPRDTVEFLVSEFSKTTRQKDVYGALQQRLKTRWLKGLPIPGFGTMQEYYLHEGLACPVGNFLRNRDMPPGLSRTNIWRVVRRALPRKSERGAAQGQANRVANTDWGAKLLRDRSRLLPLQLWTMDDVRLDLQARAFVDGKWQIVYVDAIFALDVATGYVLAFGIKPRATRGPDTEAGREAGTKMSIDGRDVRYLMCEVLSHFGLPPWLSKLLCENATAKPTNADEAAFLSILNGKLDIDYTGMGRGKLLESGFFEEWGRPGLKGWLENWFRLLHMRMNDLPGVTGRRYELSRGDLPARIEYTQQLLRRAQKLVKGPLSPDLPLMQQLRFPILSMDEVHQIVAEIVHALNWRIDHRLQGFERLFEYRDPAGNWLPESALVSMNPDDRTGLELVPRMEAPAERLQRLAAPHAGEFSKLDPKTLSALYLEKRIETVKGGRVGISDTRLGTERLIFSGDDLHALDELEGRKDGALIYLSPDYRFAVVADAASGRRVATLKREGRADLLDEHEIGKRAGEVRREYEAELAHVRSFVGEQEIELRCMRETNENLLTTPHDVVEAISEVESKRSKAASDRRLMRGRAAKHFEAGADMLATTEDAPAARATSTFDSSRLL